MLAYYDPKKPILLQRGASNYGLGAVLSHIMEDGIKRPVGFASRIFNAAENNYSLLDKEGTAIMFALKKFHKQIYGRCFVIMTNHITKNDATSRILVNIYKHVVVYNKVQ